MPEREDLGPANRVALRVAVAVVDRVDDARDQVADVDRRELAVRAGQRKQADVETQNPGKAVDEAVFLAEHDRRLEAGHVQAALAEGMQQVLALALGAQVQARTGRLVRAERAQVQQPVDAGRVAGLDQALDEIDVEAAEVALAALVQDSDQVDDDPLIGAQAAEILGVDDLRLEQADVRMDQQRAVAVRATARHRDLPAAVGEREREPLADEAAAADQENVSRLAHTAFFLPCDCRGGPLRRRGRADFLPPLGRTRLPFILIGGFGFTSRSSVTGAVGID